MPLTIMTNPSENNRDAVYEYLIAMEIYNTTISPQVMKLFQEIAPKSVKPAIYIGNPVQASRLWFNSHMGEY